MSLRYVPQPTELSVFDSVLRWPLEVVLLIFFMVLQPSALQAHQQKSGVVQLLFNDNTGNLEITHRYYLHDAEHVTNQVFGVEVNLIESSESREIFASYVRNRFAVSVVNSNGAEQRLELSYTGQEMDGVFVWIYQEIPVPEDIRELVVFNSAMKDIWEDQANLINIDHDGRVHSLDLSGSNDVGRIVLVP